MTNTPDEARLKELVKSAVVEALKERQTWITKPAAVTPSRSATVTTIAIWLLLLAGAIGLYNLVEVSAKR